MVTLARYFILPIAVVILAGELLGDDRPRAREDADGAPLHLVDRSISIVDDSGRTRAFLGMKTEPNDSVTLEIFDASGRTVLSLVQDPVSGAKLYMSDASARPFLQIFGIDDPETATRSGVLRFMGTVGEQSLSSLIGAGKVVLSVDGRPMTYLSSLPQTEK